MLQRYENYRKDPLAFLKDCVYTLDQVDKETPIKLFPIEFPYLRLYVKLWLRYPLMAVPKSRRLTMSWTNIALYVWDVLFHKGRNFAFVSKKEEDAGELVAKAEFIINHIPEDKIAKELLPTFKATVKPPRLDFKDINSRIQGYPMGADQLRQFTFSGILGDECAFWPNAEEFYAATFPTIEGGGRMSLISSPMAGFFKKLVFDTLSSHIDIERPPDTVKAPMQGIRVWVNKDNDFCVMEAHYTAHPHKRTERYKISIKKSMPLRKYQREYELNWSTFEGLPVYGDFSALIHLSDRPLHPKMGLPLLCGWDFGLNACCVVSQLQGSQLVILKEFTSNNKSINVMAPEVMTQLKMLYPEWASQENDFRHFIDPAGSDRSQTDGNTCKNIMISHGLRSIFHGAIDWESRRTAVEDRLMKVTRDGPGLILFEPDCPMLTKGFRGGYLYPESNVEIAPRLLRPLKNTYSHCFPKGTKVSTPEGLVGIESLRVGDYVITPIGKKIITATMNSYASDLLSITTAKGSTFTCTVDHPIFNGKEFVRADELRYLSTLTREDRCRKGQNIKYKSLTASGFIRSVKVTIKQALKSLEIKPSTCTVMCGSTTTELYLKDFISTTSMRIRPTIESKTLRRSTENFTYLNTPPSMLKTTLNRHAKAWRLLRKQLKLGIDLKKVLSGIVNWAKPLGQLGRRNSGSVSTAGKVMKSTWVQLNVDSVHLNARPPQELHPESMTSLRDVNGAKKILQPINIHTNDSVVKIVSLKKKDPVKVYDLTVADAHCFYAESILVSNCHDALQYLCTRVTEDSINSNNETTTSAPVYSFQHKASQAEVQMKLMSPAPKKVTGLDPYGRKITAS